MNLYPANNKISGGCKTSAGLSGWAIVFVLYFVQCQGLTPLPPLILVDSSMRVPLAYPSRLGSR
jgi:hypothetical protein